MEKPQFKELTSKLCKFMSEEKLMYRKSLVMKMNTKYKNKMQSVEESSEELKYVCTIFDT